MITLAICDDEPFFLKQLREGVDRYAACEGMGIKIMEYLSGDQLLEAERNYDIILMDLKMPGKNGIEVARELRHRGQKSLIIFITAYEEYAFDAYGVDAIHYLQKPATEEDLIHALNKAFMWMGKRTDKMLLISRDSEIQRVNLSEILYCEAVNHKLFLYTQETSYHYFGTLESLEKQLDDRFFRCHRSYIVNLDYIVSKEKDMVTVVGGARILVSRRKNQELTQRLLSLFHSEVLE